MVPRQAAVPLTLSAAFLCALLLSPGLVSRAQGQPSELIACAPSCFEVNAGLMLGCDEMVWTQIVGRAWWGPLTWQGPIQISIQARHLVAELYETIPLYIDLRTDTRAGDCVSQVGGVLRWQTLGSQAHC